MPKAYDSVNVKLRIWLLGPPQVAWQGAPVSIGRRQARALLYRLAAHSKPVPREKLAFLFWPDVPDAVARRNLVRLLSYLRQALPDPGCLIIERTSVQLDADIVWSDCAALAALSGNADTMLLAAIADEYRGRFLAGFSLPNAPEYEKWQARTAVGFEHRYLELLRTLIGRIERTGDTTAAIDYARRYLTIDELAEEAHRRLITLYGQAGDRGAVTRQFERCSLMLERELGVSPLPETRAVYEAAMAGSETPRLEPIAPRWSVRPSLDLPLLGREAALERLSIAAGRLATGGLILITGEPGVGKSRLMQAFALSSGHRVLTGNSHLATHAAPYQPLVEALRGALWEPAIWRTVRSIWLAEVSRLIPELCEHFPNLPVPVTVEPENAQARLFDAFTHCFAGLAAERPLLLCLDDLHWADAATLTWLISLIGRLTHIPFLVLATSRTEERDALADVRRSFRRADRLAEVSLGGLRFEAIQEALAAAPPLVPATGSRQLAEKLAAATGGNAFFLLETMRALQESRAPVESLDRLPVAATVHDAIQARIDKLSDIAQQVLEATAVLAPQLRLALIQETAGRSELELADALDELTSRKLLRASGRDFQFEHELAREVVYAGLTPWRKRILHGRAARSISAWAKNGELPLLTAAAQHLEASESFAEAIQSYQQAATAAQEVYAHEEAIELLRHAVELLSEPEAGSAPAVSLRESLAHSLALLGRFDEARKELQAAVAECPPEDRLSRAQLHKLIASAHLNQLYYGLADQHLERALSILHEPDLEQHETWRRLWLDVQVERLYYLLTQRMLHESEAVVLEVRPVMAHSGTPAQRARFTRMEQFAILTKERHRPSPHLLAKKREVLSLAYDKGSTLTLAFAHFDLGYLLSHAGELESAERHFLDALSEYVELGHRMGEARCLAFLSTNYRLLGNRQKTGDYARQAELAALTVGSKHYHAHSLASQAWLAYRIVDNESALTLAQQAAAYFLETTVPFAWLAHIILLALHVAVDDPAPAIAAAAVMLRPDQQRPPPKLEKLLEQALAHWEAGSRSAATIALQGAVTVAREIGYL